MNRKGGAIAYMTWIAILGILTVALIAGLGVRLILSATAGEAEDVIITGKTGADYSDTYTQFASTSALYGALYSNGLDGGYYTQPKVRESTGRFRSMVYWKKSNTDARPPTEEELVDSLFGKAQDDFNLFIERFTTTGTSIHDTEWAAEPDQEHRFRMDIDESGVNGTFALRLVREGGAPSMGTQSAVRVFREEGVTANYLRLREVGEELAEHSEGIIDARIHEAIRNAQDHREQRAAGINRVCAAGSSCQGVSHLYSNPCDRNPRFPSAGFVADQAVNDLESELNQQFRDENIEFEIEIEGTDNSPEPVEKELREEQRTFYLRHEGGGPEVCRRVPVENSFAVPVMFFVHGTVTDAVSSAASAVTSAVSSAVSATANVVSSIGSAISSGLSSIGGFVSDLFGGGGGGGTTTSGSSGGGGGTTGTGGGTTGDSGGSGGGGGEPVTSPEPQQNNLGVERQAPQFRYECTRRPGCRATNAGPEDTCSADDGEGATVCQYAHHDKAYDYEYTVKVTIKDADAEIFTPEGRQPVSLTFLLEGSRVLDNDCDGHNCINEGDGDYFESNSGPNRESVSVIDESSDVGEYTRGYASLEFAPVDGRRVFLNGGDSAEIGGSDVVFTEADVASGREGARVTVDGQSQFWAEGERTVGNAQINVVGVMDREGAADDELLVDVLSVEEDDDESSDEPPGDELPERRLLFATAGTYTVSEFGSREGGRDGANNLCFTAAQSSSISQVSDNAQRFKALMSSPSDGDARNIASSRLSIPVYNTNGQQVASGWSGLWGSGIDAPVRYDQDGNEVPEDDIGRGDVWTGTLSNGDTDSGLTCLDWYVEAMATDQVTTGNTRSTDGGWIEFNRGGASCLPPKRIYCVQTFG